MVRGHLSVVGGEGEPISVDERLAIYRDPGDTHEILARKSDRKLSLGVSDVTVSRPENGQPPVVLEPQQSCIEIHNRHNSNDITVVCENERRTVTSGRATRIDDSAKIKLGYQTRFHLAVSRKAQTEINVQGSVTGDVVAGDQTNIDRSTTVDDSVVNRSDIGGDGETSVEDSAVNRSDVGSEEDDESDTKNRCSTHNRLYEGPVCPECAASATEETGTPQTEYCISCGAEVPTAVSFCPQCGTDLSDL